MSDNKFSRLIDTIIHNLELNKYFYKFTDSNTIATDLNQLGKLQYSDIEISEPGPSKAPSTTARSCKKKLTYEEVSSSTIRVPEIVLKWDEGVEMWKNMISKELSSSRSRNPRLFVNQNTLKPKVRLIVLDFLMVLCEAYKLPRRAYHLAVDYIDRYLSINVANIPVNEYHLVGVTCLFTALKLEEKYPPQLNKFPFTLETTLTYANIKTCEENVLASLGWDIDRCTPVCWLNLYLQIHEKTKSDSKQDINQDINWEFIYPIYSSYDFIRSSQLIDLFSMDPAYLQYPYNVIAAAAVYYTYGKNTALSVSGLPWEQMRNCVEYMAAFYKAISASVDPKLKSVICFEQPEIYGNCATLKVNIPNMLTTENHLIQTNCSYVNLYIEATIIRLKQLTTNTKMKKTAIKRKMPAATKTQDNAKQAKQEKATEVRFDVKKKNPEEVSLSLPVTATVMEGENKENQAIAGNSSFQIE